jgi:squalene synthase HpnC
MMARVSSDRSGCHSRGCADLRPDFNSRPRNVVSGNRKSDLARDSKAREIKINRACNVGISGPELTLTSGDAHVIICFQLASRAEIEIMFRDQAGVDVALAREIATRSGQRLETPVPATSGDAPDAQTGMIAAKAADENFPVAMRALPGRHRRHLMAVYVFARTVDDAGDLAAPGQRMHLLTELEEDLMRLYSVGQPRLPAVAGLASTVADCGIPMQPFRDLIRANKQDQVVTRYETFPELIGYCKLSANPVGRIVLRVFGCYTPQRAQLSDAVCTGLQLAEHLQDVAEDLRAGRIYLPAADMRRFDCTERDLACSHAPPQLRQLIAFEAARAQRLIDGGARLVGTLRGFPRVAVAGYVAGGRAALAGVAAADHEVLAATPRPSKTRMTRELAAVYVTGR